MSNNNPILDKRTIGDKAVDFSPALIQGRYHMPVPSTFIEDSAPSGSYTYLYSKENSPLGIAIKYAAAIADRRKQISVYFNQVPDTLQRVQGNLGAVLYREMTTGSHLLSVYTLRFAVEVEGGFLFGCFNCPASDSEFWREAALDMLRSIAKA